MPAEYYAPLDGPWASKITSVTMPSSIRPSDGALVKVPFSGQSNFGLIYNREVLENAGVELPMKDFAAFVDACEAIKATGVTPVVVPNGENWTAQIFLLSSLTGYYTNNLDITRQLSANENQTPGSPRTGRLLGKCGSISGNGFRQR